MSMTIRHKPQGVPVASTRHLGFPAPLPVAADADASEASSVVARAIALARRLFRARISQPNGSLAESRSVFHAWARSDLAHRDVARQIWF